MSGGYAGTDGDDAIFEGGADMHSCAARGAELQLLGHGLHRSRYGGLVSCYALGVRGSVLTEGGCCCQVRGACCVSSMGTNRRNATRGPCTLA
eukprot:3646534-Rhodomonas_salina.1